MSAREIGPLTIDPYLRVVTVHDDPVALTRTEYELLLVLASEPQRCFTKHELSHTVWGCPLYGRTVDSHASRLRKKLNAHGDHFICCVWGVGYRLTDWVPAEGWEGVTRQAVAA